MLQEYIYEYYTKVLYFYCHKFIFLLTTSPQHVHVYMFVLWVSTIFTKLDALQYKMCNNRCAEQILHAVAGLDTVDMKFYRSPPPTPLKLGFFCNSQPFKER